MQIATERLILDPLHAADTAELFRIRGDPVAMQFWDWPHDQTMDATAHAIVSMLNDMASGKALYFSVRTREPNSFAGLVDLSEIQAFDSADLGFLLARVHWGKGFAFEAAAALIDHARRLHLQRLSARVHAANIRSAQLLARLGFTELAPPAAFEIRPGVMRDCCFFGLELGPGRGLSDRT